MSSPTPPADRFLDESVLPDFTALRMTAFGRSVIDIANDPAFDAWTFSQKVLYALDKEVAARRERRINKLLKASRSPNLDACLENVVCTPDRNINPEQVSRLAHGQWCHLGQNIVILGKSSVGKTYLAQALITAACRNDYSARFYRTDMLAAELAVLQPDDPARLKFIQHLHDVDVLVLHFTMMLTERFIRFGKTLMRFMVLHGSPQNLPSATTFRSTVRLWRSGCA